MQTKLSVNKAVFLTLIMILMTQTGYLENISNFEEIETNNFEKLSSNGGSNNLIPSVEGADLMVGDLMDDITFQYDSSAASGSGSGSGSGGSGTSGITTYGNGSTWNVVDLRGSQGSDPGISCSWPSVTRSTSMPTTEAKEENCGRMTPPTTPLG